ncbi:MAG: ATP-binding protein [Fibrobacterales bacterium]
MSGVTEEVQQVLHNASRTWGTEFFNAITKNLGVIIKADYLFIGKVNCDASGVDTIGLWGKGAHQHDFYYDLEGTPCKDVSDDSICCYLNDVTKLYPKDTLLIEMNIEGYVGTPLKNSRGEVFALLVALFESPITEREHILTLFELFAGRVSAELEREERERQLKELNDVLEHTIEERTHELSEKNNALEKVLHEVEEARETLIENEKLATLGSLVAGIAHEVNTPLGVALTASTGLHIEYERLKSLFDDSILKKSDMHLFLDSADQAFGILERNLERSAEIIRNFKKISADQGSGEERTINLKEYVDEILQSLKPAIKKTNITFNNKLPQGILLNTSVGAIYQVFSNLCMNVIHNGYSENQKGWVFIEGAIENSVVVITVSNGGAPISESLVDTLFDPFITSRRGRGGTGLGLHIVKNVVNSVLKGSIELTCSQTPVTFTITIPGVLDE